MQATLTFLGSGTSMGVPTLGCTCAVCTSADPKNRRTRPSIAVQYNDHTVLIDTGPDFHAQALREHISRVDAVLYTHPHADHVLGLDDLRPLSFRTPAGIPLFADPTTTAALRRVFDYTFDPAHRYPTSARVSLHPIPPPGQSVPLFGAEFLHIPVIHGRQNIVGYRFGSAAYLTDLSDLHPEAYPLLENLDILIIDALRREPHPSHSHLAKSIAFVERINPRRAYFTHISHDLDQSEIEAILPPNIHLAYDGLKLTFDITPPQAQTRIFHSLAEIPPGFGQVVATIGNFDGVHRGHRQVITRVNARARALGLRSLAITFDPHPVRVLRPDAPHSLITPLPEKLELLATTGVDAVLVLPFTPALAALTPLEFARDLLRDSIHTAEIHEGETFRFGYKASADMHALELLGQDLGFKATICPPQFLRGAPISSSRIRTLIAAGSLAQARALLGRSFAIRSTPASGRGYGTRYTVPTINLAPYPELLPANGVYITTLRIGQECFRAVTNVGNRPTFGADSFTVESHLLNFHPVGLTEDTPLELTFLKRLRPEHRFPTPDALRTQIGLDVQRANRFFTLARL